MTTRRSLLAYAALTPIALLGIAGCAGTLTPSAALTDAQSFLTSAEEGVAAFTAAAGSEISATAQADIAQLTGPSGYLTELGQLIASAQGVITPTFTGSAANYIDLAIAVLTTLATLVPIGAPMTKQSAYAAALGRAHAAAAKFHSDTGLQ